MINYCSKKIFFYFFMILLAIGYTVFIYISGITYGRKIQIHLDLPRSAWEKTALIKIILDNSEKKPDCQLELFLNLDAVAYNDSVSSIPKWEKGFFSNKMKKHIAHNEQILKLLREYREQYPLSEEYFLPCSEHLDVDYGDYRVRVKEAWRFIMNEEKLEKSN